MDTQSDEASIAAGRNQTISSAGSQSFIGGGNRNRICDVRSAIGAGERNQVSSIDSFITAGVGNVVGAGCPGLRRDVTGTKSSAILAGENNTVSTAGGTAAIPTGTNNLIGGITNLITRYFGGNFLNHAKFSADDRRHGTNTNRNRALHRFPAKLQKFCCIS